MVNYFSTMADGIGIGYEESNECKFDTHESIVQIEKATWVKRSDNKSFEFRSINQIEVKETLDKISTSHTLFL